MGKTIWGRHSTGQFLDSSYLSIGSQYGSGQDQSNSESTVRVKLFHDGEFSNFRYRFSQGSSAIIGFEGALRISGVDAITLPTSSGTPVGWQGPELGPFEVAAGDYASIAMHFHGYNCFFAWTAVNFEADGSDHVQYYTKANDAWNIADGAGVYYAALVGGFPVWSEITSSDNISVQIQKAGRIEHGRIRIGENASSGELLVQLVVNGVAGDPSVIVPAARDFEDFDLSGGVDVVPGDVVHWQFTAAAAGLIRGRVIQCAITNTVDDESDLFACADSAQTHTAGSASYFPIFAACRRSASVSVIQVPLGFDASVSKIRLEVYDNTCTQAQHMKLYVDGVASPTLDCIIPAGFNGICIDADHADDVLAEERLCLGITGSGSGSFKTKWTAITAGEASLTEELPAVPEPIILPLDSGRDPTLRQRLVNMYTEPTPKGPTKFSRYQRPGLEAIVTLGDGPIRASFKWNAYRYTVSGDAVYRDTTLIGSLFGASRQVRFAFSDEEVVVVSGGRAWYVTTTAVTEISDPDLPANVVDVAFLAGRFVYITSNNTVFYYSAINDAQTIDGLAFATAAENTADVLVRVAVLSDQLVFFTTKVMEYWSPSANIAAPFIRSPGRKVDLGLASRHSVILLDNALFFVGYDKQVYRSGAVPLKVSNFEVDDYLRQATTEELLEDCHAFTVNFGGHEFYVVHIPNNGTWAYDLSMKEWAEWRSWNRGRFRVLCAEDNFMGDFYTGKIVGFNGGKFTDVDGDDEPIERVINYFKALENGRLPNTNIVLACTRGTTDRLEGYGYDPVCEMAFSDDEGRTYSDWRAQRIGQQGERTAYAKAVWHKLGRIQPPGRHFLFRCTDPVRWSPFGVGINVPRP